MSVKKRKQAKAFQEIASKLPLTNIAGMLLLYYCATQAFQLGQGLMSWIYGLLGGMVGLLAFGAFQKPLQQAENRWRVQVRALAQKIESKIDEEQGGNNKLLDAYELQYMGGHPGWTLKGKAEFGTLEVYEKTLIFKNKTNRIKFQLARIKRITCEPDKVLRLKKLETVHLPKPMVLKNAIANRLVALVQKRQRFLAVDYLDDLGAKHLVVFYPVLGNPLVAKNVKAAIEAIVKKLPKEKTKTTVLQQATDQQIAAAEAASRRSHESGPEIRYQVVLEKAGSTPEEHEAIAHQMASLFNVPADKAHAALQRLPMVAKRNLPADQARKLADALSAIGASARAEAMSPTPTL